MGGGKKRERPAWKEVRGQENYVKYWIQPGVGSYLAHFTHYVPPSGFRAASFREILNPVTETEV